MGKYKNQTIDYLDIAIPIPAQLIETFTLWLEEFDNEYDYTVRSPRLKKDLLKINSSDLIAFLGYVQPDQLSEFESKKFMSDIKSQFEQNSNLTTSKDFRNHYQWCLAALNHFKWGRHREEGA